MRSKHPFRAMCCPVNVYCDRDISCIVIVTYHVLISVLLVSYVVSIQYRLISLRFTSIVKASNTRFFFYKEPVYKEPTCRRPKYLKNLYY